MARRVQNAYQRQTPLRIVGGNSKETYGENITGEAFRTGEHRGIIAYEPSELFITARCGTPLSEIEDALRQEQQMLPFEPPRFSDNATIGGCLASGLSGPARMTYGAVRDATLGVKIINGRGEILRFGGQMIKNVAGYDAGRLMCGALGTLGVILEVSFRVMPMPEHTATIKLPLSETSALQTVREYINAGKPLSASFYDGDYLYLRLSGYRRHIEQIIASRTTETLNDDADFWYSVTEHRHRFFKDAHTLWRLSLPPAAASLDLPGEQVLEWGGALRWLSSPATADVIRAKLEQARGYACLFKNSNNSNNSNTAATPIFHPLKPALLALHRRVKQAFDPAGILNRGRLYPEL